jgi:hypothetical protein
LPAGNHMVERVHGKLTKATRQAAPNRSLSTGAAAHNCSICGSVSPTVFPASGLVVLRGREAAAEVMAVAFSAGFHRIAHLAFPGR